MALKKDFEQAQKKITKLSYRPDNQILLNLYGLFKQATEGDVKGTRPGLLDIKSRAKFDVWKKLSGMDQEKAMQAYVDLVSDLLKKDT